MCKEYNGYTNYQTWCVSLWIDNDEGLYNMIGEIAESTWDNAEESDHFSKENDAIYSLEENIKTIVNEFNPIINQANMHNDLLGYALSSVNWYEITENWIENVKENE